MNETTVLRQKVTGKHIVVTIGILIFSLILGGIYTGVASTFFTAIANDSAYNISMGVLSGVSIPRNLVLFILMPVGGMLLSKKPKLALIIGAVFLTVPYFVQGYFTEGWQFYVSGAVLGIGGSIATYSTVPTILSRWWSVNVNTMIGLGLALTSVGNAVFFPLIAQWITVYGWQDTTKVIGLAGCALMVLVILFMIKPNPADSKLLPAGEPLNADKSGGKPKAILNGVDSKRILRSPSFYFTFAFSFCITMFLTFRAHQTNYAVQLGFTLVEATGPISAGAIAAVVSKFAFGFIVDKTNLRVARLMGYATMVVSVILFFVSANGNYAVLMAAGFLFGFGGGMVALVPICAAAYYGRRDFAKANALVGMGNALGGAVGVALYGIFYDMTSNYYTSLIALAVFVAVVIIAGELGEITAKPLKAEFTTNEEPQEPKVEA